MNKLEVRRAFRAWLSGLPDGVGSAVDLALTALAVVCVIWGVYRLWSTVRHGAKSLDMLAVPLGSALICNWIAETYWHDLVSWIGPGIGLVLGVLICRDTA